MKRIFISLASAALVSASALAADVAVTPGSLAAHLEKLAGTDIKDITLTGGIDARDLSLMRSLPQDVTVLDLTGVNVWSYTSKEKLFNRNYLEANTIPDYCFFRTAFKEVKLPENLTVIGAGAFAGSDVETVVIPEGVETIGDYAFYDCKSLRNVLLPTTLKSIGKGAFAGCVSLTGMDMTDTQISAIPETLFAGCSKLRVVKIPSSASSIGKEAFRGTSVLELDLPDVTDLQPYSLSGMSALKVLRLNPAVKVGEGALIDDTALAVVSGIPADLPDLFAANCPNLNISAYTEKSGTIGRYAFANSQASTLVLGASLFQIGDGAFHSITGLKSISADALESAVPTVTEHTFDGLDRPEITLHVTDDSYDVWASHPEWGQFNVVSNTKTDIITMEDESGVTFLLTDHQLKVTAPQDIKRIEIYSTDARLLLSAEPAAASAVVSLAAITDSPVIVNVEYGTSASKAIKLML